MKYFFLLILLVIGLFVTAQKNKRLPLPLPPSSVSQDQIKRNSECVFTGKYSPDYIAKAFPFNLTTRIILVSYDNIIGYVPMRKSEAKIESREVISFHYARKNDEDIIDSVSIDTGMFKEIKMHEKNQFKVFLDILFNY
jgi:hypothetical protein